MASVSELLDSFVENFNAGRFEGALEDFAPDGVLEEVGTGRRFTPQESVESARAWKAAFPDARGTIERTLIDGDRGAAEIVWTGTNSGPLLGQPPTGKAVTIRAVAVLETAGGKITRARHYLDVAGMMAQLGTGAAPTAGAGAR
jgi:steroid delta-isomerase-like uncharacterized protein